MLNLTGQEGIDALATFSASNFAIAGSPQPTPKTSGVALMGGGLMMVAVPVARRRYRK